MFGYIKTSCLDCVDERHGCCGLVEVQHCLPWTNRLKSIAAYSINHKPRPTSGMSCPDMLKLKTTLLHIINKYMNYELNNFVIKLSAWPLLKVGQKIARNSMKQKYQRFAKTLATLDIICKIFIPQTNSRPTKCNLALAQRHTHKECHNNHKKWFSSQ